MSSLKLSVRGLTALLSTAFVSGSILMPFGTTPAAAEVRLLGETKLPLVFNNTDVIQVESCNPRVNRIQLRAKHADANIKALLLRFKNGQTEQLEVRSVLKQGQSTRWIELPGSQRCIDRIAITGSSELGSSFSPAKIEFFGEVASNDGNLPGSSSTRVLGETKLSFSANELDVIRVESCRPLVTGLQLRAKHADANIKFLALRFKNGDTEQLDVRRSLQQGQLTPLINLPGSARCIDKIGIIGSSVLGSNFNQAKIEFIGHVKPDFSSVPPPANSGQPRLLGATRLSLFTNETDVVKVDACRPRISSLQLRAKNADANISKVVVTFGNGEKQELDMRSTLQKEQRTRWIPLDGRGGRCVTQIRVLGDRAFNFQFSPARVEFWGQ
jgi:hypothetical protein